MFVLFVVVLFILFWETVERVCCPGQRYHFRFGWCVVFSVWHLCFLFCVCFLAWVCVLHFPPTIPLSSTSMSSSFAQFDSLHCWQMLRFHWKRKGIVKRRWVVLVCWRLSHTDVLWRANSDGRLEAALIVFKWFRCTDIRVKWHFSTFCESFCFLAFNFFSEGGGYVFSLWSPSLR